MKTPSNKSKAASNAPRSQKNSKSIACYVRVSTTSQNEAGQRQEIQRWLDGNGIDPANIRWFIDKGKSGDSLERPAFQKMQQAVFMGEVGTIVVYKLDRISRKLHEGITTLCEWCDKGIRVVATSQAIDFNGSVGKIIASVLLGVAEMEQETRRERQAVGIAVAKQSGKYQGRKAGTTKAKPARAAKLREQGLTVAEIAKSLGVSRNTVHVYLRKVNA